MKGRRAAARSTLESFHRHASLFQNFFIFPRFSHSWFYIRLTRPCDVCGSIRGVLWMPVENEQLGNIFIVWGKQHCACIDWRNNYEPLVSPSPYIASSPLYLPSTRSTSNRRVFVERLIDEIFQIWTLCGQGLSTQLCRFKMHICISFFADAITNAIERKKFALPILYTKGLKFIGRINRDARISLI